MVGVIFLHTGFHAGALAAVFFAATLGADLEAGFFAYPEKGTATINAEMTHLVKENLC